MTKPISRRLILLAIAVISVSGCQDKRHTGTGRVYDAANKFSIVPPPGWTPAEEAMGSFLICTGPAEGGFAANLNVNVNPETRGPDQPVAEIKGALGKILTNYEPMEEGFLTIDGKKALLLSSRFKMGQNDLQNLQYAIFTGSKVYTITFTCLSSDFAKYRPTLEQSALTARVE